MQRQDIRRAKFYHPGIGRGWSGYLSRTQFLRRPGVETTDCFICLDEVRKNQQQTFDMPCCGHIIHLKCWGKWTTEQRAVGQNAVVSNMSGTMAPR